MSIYANAGHDDGLFLKNAASMLFGHWLGDYSNMTLAKGPGWPIFISFNALLGIPITLSIALFYLFACYLLVIFLLKEKVSELILLPLFVLILFHPAMFPVRIIRDDIYSALTLISFCGLAYAMFDKSFMFKTFFMFGLCFGMLIITREESLWLMPGFLISFCFGLLYQYKNKLSWPIFFKRQGVFFGGAFLVVTLICCINYYKYHIYQVSDFKEREFSNVLLNLNSVQIKHELPYLPVSKEKRELIYSISPAFSELKEFFESPDNGWKKHGCAVYSWTCGDYASGWFMWALRDGVASKGYYENAPKASAFYKKINAEIEIACEKNFIVCKKSFIPFIPNISYEQLLMIAPRLFDAVRMAIGATGLGLTGGPSDDSSNLNNVRIFLGNPMSILSSSEGIISINGWFYSARHNWFTLACNSKDGNKIYSIERLKSSDIANYFHDKNSVNQRFSFKISSNDHCTIISDRNAKNQLNLNSVISENKKYFLSQDEIIYFDNYSANVDYNYRESLSIKKFLINFYSVVMPFLCIFGFLAFTISTTRILMNKIYLNKIWILSLGAWTLVITRLLMLTIIDISSFPAINPLYFSAIYPLLILATFLSIISFMQIFSDYNKFNFLKDRVL